jgi:hypothetical protein
MYCEKPTSGNDHSCRDCGEYWRGHCASCERDITDEIRGRTGGFCEACFEDIKARHRKDEQERPERERREEEALLKLGRGGGICPHCWVVYDESRMQYRSEGRYSTCYVCGGRMLTKRQVDGARAVLRKHPDLGMHPVRLASLIESLGYHVVRGKAVRRRHPNAY